MTPIFLSLALSLSLSLTFPQVGYGDEAGGTHMVRNCEQPLSNCPQKVKPTPLIEIELRNGSFPSQAFQ